MHELNQINWADKFYCNEPNVVFEGFHKTIERLVNTHLPMRKMTKKEIINKQKPWITNDILKLIKQRNKLHNKFLKAKDESSKTSLNNQYRALRNQIVSKCRLSKKEYYQNFFEENSGNLRNTWRGIKTIININSKDKINPSSLSIDGNSVNDPEKIANEFNNYFSGIAGKLQSSIHTQDLKFETYLEEKSAKSFFIEATHKFEIIDAIISNINNKSSGPNSIPTIILNLIKESIAEPLAEIINLSFSTGIYIEKLKISKIIPIYKEKGDKLLTKNYRPISLLSNLNKIVEKIVHKRLYSFLEKEGKIYEKQFGFRKKHSTTHALLDLTEDIRDAIDKNKFSCGVFIDLQKAFDTVDHNILLKKLDHYGIRGVNNKWFGSYLKNRRQYVSISGIDSQLTKSGVWWTSGVCPWTVIIFNLHK